LKKLISFIIALNLYAAFPSWYYKVKNTSGQKQAFVEIMLPLIQAENEKISALRKQLKAIFSDPYYLLNPYKIAFLAKTAQTYKIKNITDKEEFLKRVNIIPPSLALAQAAIESGWGKSRFVKEANNIFGHWTYSNRGLAPKSKYEHIKTDYSIRIFPSLEASIAAYMKNLNRNRAYEEFRNLRERFDKEDKPFTGLDAADTMIRYSQKKEAYVKLIKNMIQKNGWLRFDKQ
jgi:Bax protein